MRDRKWHTSMRPRSASARAAGVGWAALSCGMGQAHEEEKCGLGRECCVGGTHKEKEVCIEKCVGWEASVVCGTHEEKEVSIEKCVGHACG